MSGKQPIRNPNNKIGIKTLTEEQMRTNLPSYDVLISRIEKIREVAKAVSIGTLRNDIVESLKYDNILSIIGGRGAGKTSMLFTIYNDLKEDEKNIVLPIIMPELIDEHESIVSSLLSAMRQNLDCIENKIECCSTLRKSERCEEICKKYRFFDRCTFNKKNKLRNQFENLVSAFYSKENKNYGSNYPENEELMAKSQDNSFNLINLFVEYWNSLQEVYSSYLECRNQKGDEPLVFIILDDTDLKPQIINELLFIIPKYLSHPNVVVIVSAAHKTLSYAVKNHMFKSMTGKHIDLVDLMNEEMEYRKCRPDNTHDRIDLKEMRFGKEYHKICRLSEEVLRKLFPVYNRFYLRNYERYEDKKLFMMFERDESDCNSSIPIVQKIGKLLGDSYKKIIFKHNMYLKTIKIKTNKSKNEPSLETLEKKCERFSVIDNKPEISLKDSTTIYKEQQPVSYLKTEYLSFFGKYPRDISAVYYSLKETVVELENKLDELYRGNCGSLVNGIPALFLEQVCDVLLKFINAVINSNRDLIMFSQCADKLIIPQLLNWQLYVDYSKVLKVFQDERYVKENKQNCNPFIEMICLLNFVEQLIVLVMPQRKSFHGDEEFNKLMRLCNINIVKNSGDINDLLNQYFIYHAFGVVPSFDINNITHQHNFIKALNSIESISKKKRKKGIIHDSNIDELISEVFYRRFDPFARIVKHHDDLFVFDKYRFVGKEYSDFLQKYTQYMHERLRELARQIRLDYTIVANEKTNYQTNQNIINEYYWSLSINSEDLMLSFTNVDEIVSVAKGIEKNSISRYDYDEIKEQLYELMRSINSKRPIKRYILEIQSSDLLDAIQDVKRGYLELKDWYNKLERSIEDGIVLTEQYNENREFLFTLNKLTESPQIYFDYINYYVDIIRREIIKENGDLYEHFKVNNNVMIDYNLQRFENDEWYNIIDRE